MDKELVDRGHDKRYCEGGEYRNTTQLGGSTDQVLKEGRGVYEGYVGSLKDGKPHGKGFFKARDGTTYSGQWEDGLMHGKGTLTRLDGHKAVGLFEYNQHNPLDFPVESIEFRLFVSEINRIYQIFDSNQQIVTDSELKLTKMLGEDLDGKFGVTFKEPFFHEY